MKLVPDLDVAVIETSRRRMAGALDYLAEIYEISNAMAEPSLLPTLSRAETGRQPIHCGSGRQAICLTQVLRGVLAERPK